MDSTAAGINANGQHFVCRGAEFNWMHPADLRDGDIDCTFLSDEEFEQVVGHAVPVVLQ